MKSTRHLTAFVILTLLTSVSFGQEVFDDWRYTLRKPADGWRLAAFDDSDWKEASGGFGTRGTPGSRVGTTWATNSIWLRKSFDLAEVPAKPALMIHHDEDVEVYLNGKNVATLKGSHRSTRSYQFPMVSVRRSSTAAT